MPLTRKVISASLDGLRRIPGLECLVPDGAFYALMKLDTDKSDLEIVESLIREYGIAVMPGCGGC